MSSKTINNYRCPLIRKGKNLGCPFESTYVELNVVPQYNCHYFFLTRKLFSTKIS